MHPRERGGHSDNDFLPREPFGPNKRLTAPGEGTLGSDPGFESDGFEADFDREQITAQPVPPVRDDVRFIEGRIFETSHEVNVGVLVGYRENFIDTDYDLGGKSMSRIRDLGDYYHMSTPRRIGEGLRRGETNAGIMGLEWDLDHSKLERGVDF